FLLRTLTQTQQRSGRRNGLGIPVCLVAVTADGAEGVGCHQSREFSLVKRGSEPELLSVFKALFFARLHQSLSCFFVEAFDDTKAQANRRAGFQLRVVTFVLEAMIPVAMHHIHGQYSNLVSLGILNQLGSGIKPHGQAIQKPTIKSGWIMTL